MICCFFCSFTLFGLAGDVALVMSVFAKSYIFTGNSNGHNSRFWQDFTQHNRAIQHKFIIIPCPFWVMCSQSHTCGPCVAELNYSATALPEMLECCDKCLLKCFAANVDLETWKHQHSVIQHSLRSQEIWKHRFKDHHFHTISLFSVLLCALQAFSLSLFSSFQGLPWQMASRYVAVQKKKMFL